jgi:hypothetical protein
MSKAHSNEPESPRSGEISEKKTEQYTQDVKIFFH